MPLYEYACDACGAREEKLESFSAPAAHACPDCGSGAGMKRQISAAAVAVASSPSGASACATGACPFACG